MSLVRHLKLRLFFTKSDIFNMFYTLQTPQDCDSGIRVQIRDDVYGSLWLPFGWAHSPVPAQELFGMYLSMEHPDEVIVNQYFDDVPAFNTDRELLLNDTRQLAHSLQ